MQSVEEKRNFRNAVFLISLSIAVVVILVVFGIPVVGKVASYVSSMRSSSSGSNDKTPPAPPKFDVFPDFTNQTVISLGGSAEPGAIVKLTFNGNEQEVVVDRNGSYSFQNLGLRDGENKFSAFTVDPAGNTSQTTDEKTIVFDNKPPSLGIDSPSDGSTFFGSEQRQVTINGVTDNGASVTINDRIVSIEESGSFQYSTTLSSGENKFTIKSVDQAGNSVEKSLTLNFSE